MEVRSQLHILASLIQQTEPLLSTK